jgi:outer membrane protein OmpA-like peptidoglycan-associated protein
MNTSRAITALVTAILLSIATLPRSAHADETQPDNWGNAPDTRTPHPDAKGRSGHWWWPEAAQDSGVSTTINGNKGRVFSAWTPTQEDIPTEEPQPSIPENPPLGCYKIILNNVLFKSNSFDIRPEGKAEIDKVVAEMQKFIGDTVTCVGHADDTGSEAYNQQLGLRRAQAVVYYMKASGVAPERVFAVSKGETEPAVPNDTAPNRALNRRVVFQYKFGN